MQKPLSQLIDTVQQYTVAAFLDTEEVFNNVSTNSIQETLTIIRFEGYFTHLIISMLKTKTIQSDLGGSVLIRAVSRGRPQGGAISSVLFW